MSLAIKIAVWGIGLRQKIQFKINNLDRYRMSRIMSIFKSYFKLQTLLPSLHLVFIDQLFWQICTVPPKCVSYENSSIINR